jgi:hypothetical protein
MMEETMNVKIFYDAELNAREQFGLNTKADLIAFIGNQGLQKLEYVNTKLWENKPKETKDIYIDAYKFRSNEKVGYIAFMKGVDGKYAIKSFHIDHDKLTIKDLDAYSTKQLKDGK